MIDIKVGWQSGVAVSAKEAKIILDPTSGRRVGKNAYVLVSHAHADHTYGLGTKARKYAAPETIAIYEKASRKRLEDVVPVKLSQRIRAGDINIIPLNAGHMLGSTQFLLETPEKTILYTGDINCVDTLTTESAHQAECDELIMEATYGDPFYVFPNRQKVYARIVEWAAAQARNGKAPIFQVYAAGKAQEIVRLFNLYTTLPVIASPSVSRVNEAHTRFGIKLKYEDASGREGSELVRGVHVFVTTYRDAMSFSGKSSRAVATGWALRMPSRNFAAFPLSSHADFRQLASYVKATGARKIYVYTGYADIFSEYLRKQLSVDARPLPALAQTELYDFQIS